MPARKHTGKPTPLQVIRIAAHAPADPRTVRKVLAGDAVQEMVRERVLRAVEELGLSELLVSESAA